jgi:hypothetical protein
VLTESGALAADQPLAKARLLCRQSCPIEMGLPTRWGTSMRMDSIPSTSGARHNCKPLAGNLRVSAGDRYDEAYRH